MMAIPSPEVCETYAAILLKPRKVEFKPGVWHMQPPGEICEAAAAALRQHHALVKALEQIARGTPDEFYPFRAMGYDQMKQVARAALSTRITRESGTTAASDPAISS